MDILSKYVTEATLKKLTDELEDKVNLIHFTQEPSRLVLPDYLKGQECVFCKETKELLKEVTALSDKLELKIYDFVADIEKAKEYGIDKIPATILLGKENYGIGFYGIPSGYEYASLIEAIIDVSKSKTKLSQKTIDAIRDIDKDVHIQIFITPTCPYCTMAVRLGHQFALESSHIKADMIESTEFPHLTQKYNVIGVPKTIINETVSIEGAVPEDIFLEKVLNSVNPEIKK